MTVDAPKDGRTGVACAWRDAGGMTGAAPHCYVKPVSYRRPVDGTTRNTPAKDPFKRGCWHQYWVASVPGSLHGGGHLTRRWRRHVAGLRRTELTVTTLTGNDDLRLLGRFFLVGL